MTTPDLNSPDMTTPAASLAHRRRRLPVKPVALLLAFLLLQLVGVKLYVTYDDLLTNVSIPTVRDAYLPAFFQAPKGPATAAAASGPARSVPVLVYHGVVNKPDGSNMLLADFRDQMFALKRAGWNAVSLTDFERYLAGERALPDRSFLLTFDDGRKDSYYPVDPILAALDFHATMFLITSHAFDRDGSESTYYLNRDELLRMKASGRWDLQAHSRKAHDLLPINPDGRKGHFYSNLLWLAEQNRMETEAEFQERVRADLRGAKADLERELDIDVTTMAFPFGDYGQDSLNHPKAQEFVLAETAATYRYAFAQEEAKSAAHSHNLPGANRSLLQRIKVFPDWTGANLRKVLEIGVPKPETFSDTFTDHAGWSPNYGRMRLDTGALVLTPTAEGKGASVLLDGSAGWRNYRVSVPLSWPTDGTVSLVARYRDERDYLSCTLRAQRLRAEQRIAGEHRILGEVVLPSPPTADLTMEITVSGTTVSCGGPATLTATADPVGTPPSGGLGLKVWSPTPGQARAVVKGVHVAPA